MIRYGMPLNNPTPRTEVELMKKDVETLKQHLIRISEEGRKKKLDEEYTWCVNQMLQAAAAGSRMVEINTVITNETLDRLRGEVTVEIIGPRIVLVW